MTHGVRLYLVGSLVLVSLAGCGRGFFQSAEREPWRAEAELACLKSGTVKENAELVRINPISGPGVCGAEYPLKVAALGEASGSFGFADDLRPPGAIGNGPRWPVSPPRAAPPPSVLSRQRDAPAWRLWRAVERSDFTDGARRRCPGRRRDRARRRGRRVAGRRGGYPGPSAYPRRTRARALFGTPRRRRRCRGSDRRRAIPSRRSVRWR